MHERIYLDAVFNWQNPCLQSFNIVVWQDINLALRVNKAVVVFGMDLLGNRRGVKITICHPHEHKPGEMTPATVHTFAAKIRLTRAKRGRMLIDAPGEMVEKVLRRLHHPAILAEKRHPSGFAFVGQSSTKVKRCRKVSGTDDNDIFFSKQPRAKNALNALCLVIACNHKNGPNKAV